MSNYSKRQHLIELLTDFAEFVSEEVCDDRDIQTVISNPTYTELVEGILTDMEVCCSLEIEHDFKKLTKSLENGEFDLEEFEATVEDIFTAIERISFQNSNQYEDGLSVSDSYDFFVAVDSTASPKPSFTPPLKKEVAEEIKTISAAVSETVGVIPDVTIKSWIRQDYLMSYLLHATENKTIAWTTLGDMFSKQFAISTTEALTQNYFVKNTQVKYGYSHFANFDVTGYKQYVSDYMGDSVVVPDSEKDKEYVLIHSSLGDETQTFNLLSCVADFGEEFADQPLNLRQAFANGDKHHSLLIAILFNARFFEKVKDSDADKDSIALSYARFNSYYYMLRFLVRLYGSSSDANLSEWCDSMRDSVKKVAVRLAYYTLKKIEAINPKFIEMVKKATEESSDEANEVVDAPADKSIAEPPPFRQMINSLCIVLNDTKSIALLNSKMPANIKANSVLSFCYLDKTFGMSFQVLGLTYFEDGDYALVWTPEDTGLIVRGDTYEELQIIPIHNKALENRFSSLISTRRSDCFDSNTDIGKTRNMECLDSFRHFSSIDDVLVHIINNNVRKQEKIWAKLKSYVGVINNEEVFTATLINKPFDACFGMNSGDTILVVRRKEWNDDFILVGIKCIPSHQQPSNYDERANRRYPKLSKEDKARYRNVLYSVEASLTPREANMMNMLLGLGDKDPMSPLEISKVYDVCVNRVYQIEAKFMRKLRHLK